MRNLVETPINITISNASQNLARIRNYMLNLALMPAGFYN